MKTNCKVTTTDREKFDAATKEAAIKLINHAYKLRNSKNGNHAHIIYSNNILDVFIFGCTTPTAKDVSVLEHLMFTWYLDGEPVDAALQQLSRELAKVKRLFDKHLGIKAAMGEIQ